MYRGCLLYTSGDWGQSYFLDVPVLTAIAEYFGPTLSLAILAQVVSLVFAIPMGMLAAYKREMCIRDSRNGDHLLPGGSG